MNPEVGSVVVHRSCLRWCGFQTIPKGSVDVPIESVILVLSIRCHLIPDMREWKREMAMVVLERQRQSPESRRSHLTYLVVSSKSSSGGANISTG